MATTIGFLGVLLWSFSALFMAVLKNIPPAQIIAIALGVSFILSAIKITYQGHWHQLKQPAVIWFFGIIGIIVNNFAYIGATKFAPVEQVSLIVSLAPIFLIVFATLILKENFQIKYLLSGIVGLLGVYVLVTQGKGLSFINMDFVPGYVLALIAALTWASYTLSLRYHKAPIDMIGIFCGLGALCAAIIHFNFETTVIPNTEQWLVLAGLGTMMLWLAYYLWAFGIMHGDIRLLSIYLYTIPVFSIIWLILFGKTNFTPALAFSVMLIIGASVLAQPSKKKKLSTNINDGLD